MGGLSERNAKQHRMLAVDDSPVLGATAAEFRAMDEAIIRALEAVHETGKAGIAASVLRDGQIIARGENEVHLQSDPTKHAEMVAITRAAAALQTTDLSDCVIVSTLQPCEMCLRRSVSPGSLASAAGMGRARPEMDRRRRRGGADRPDRRPAGCSAVQPGAGPLRVSAWRCSGRSG